MNHDTRDIQRCAYTAIIGRTNAGKSTLFNALVGMHLASITRKAQTTRHNIRGVLTEGATQLIFVDTPGIHADGKRLLNQVLNRNARAALMEVDLSVLVMDCSGWRDEDERVLRWIAETPGPCLLAINKVDTLAEKSALLPLIDSLQAKHAFTEIIPLSARTGYNVDALKRALQEQAPEGEFIFPPDQVSDRPERFLAAEAIREKLFSCLEQELPYAVHIEIDTFEESATLTSISATIWVERDTQKAIVIGKHGGMLKTIGSRARQSLERLLDCKVYLKLWVKVQAGWPDDPAVMRGYEE